MRNLEAWTASKYVYKREKLIASRDVTEVGVGSRLVTDIVAAAYDKYIKQYARGRLIDLGCGKVPLFAAYKDYAAAITCVEWGNSLHRNPYVDVWCDLTQTLPFRDGEFDTIILSDVLEHIPQPEGLWKEMSRILSASGRVLISVPFYYWIHEKPYDYYRYTEYGLRRLAEQSSFKVIALEALGGAPEIIADILSKTLLHFPKAGRILSTLIQEATSVFVRTPVGKNISNMTSAHFPLEYFLVAEKCEVRQ